MNKKKVAILISTYNGEKFIREQLDSLINQTYKNITIIIRDDGSKDNTIKIIKEYQKKYDNIVLFKKENIGFINSFFELLSISKEEYDYYAYCDQDDVWMNNKIERAVNFLNKEKSNIPLLYFSNSDYYSYNMEFMKTAEKNKYYNFRNSLFECVTQGMTMVINNATRKVIVENRPKKCLFHDWWTYMICSGMGKVIYDNESLVKYRRHNKSVTVEGKSKIQLFKWRIKEFILGESLKEIKGQWIEYKSLFYDRLNEEDKKILDLFCDKKRIMKKVFYPKKLRRKKLDDLSVRLLMLFRML